MPIRILAVGKRHEAWILDGIQRYEKRFQRPFDVSWVLLPHSPREGNESRQEESERLLGRIADDEYVVLLDERGKLYSSPQISTLIETPLNESRPVTLVIGGAYGVNEAVAKRADAIWSLSPLVFPHQIVRLLVIEQLYRAQEIARGGQYHHD